MMGLDIESRVLEGERTDIMVDEDRGIVPRALSEIFDHIKEDTTVEYKVIFFFLYGSLCNEHK